MARSRRGIRSQTAKEEKGRVRRVDVLEKHPMTTTKVLKTYPDEYKNARSAKQVHKITRRRFGSVTGAALPTAPSEGLYVVKPPTAKTLPPDHPETLCIRAEGIVPPFVRAEILAAWDRLQACDFRYHHHSDSNRSATPAMHCGIWHHSSARPNVTSDTQQKDPKTRECLEDLLQLIKTHIAPIVKGLLMAHSPNLWEKHKRAYEYVRANVNDPLGQFASVDFGGAFFTIAMKEGSSERLHIDFHDHSDSITWLVPLGDWVGGDFVCPQIGERIPVRPGQILGATTRKLVHAGTPIQSGRRLVLTLFTDKTLISQSRK